MKYKSELIKEIVESRGHEKSSIHYESECVESWVEETKGAYPKLCDYQSEWLNYINENPIGNFPYEIITDVTEATVNNVVPYAYKSAILSGQTLVNIVNNDNWVKATDNKISLFTQNISIKKGQSYTVIGKMESSDMDNPEGNIVFRIRTGTDNSGESLLLIEQSGGVFKQTFTNNDNDTIHLRFFNQKTNYKKLMIIEGDYTNVDISYFEGIQSVKMPVLTTTGKNLFDGKWEFGGIGNNNGIEFASTSSVRSVNYINVKPNTAYVASSSQLHHTNIVVWCAYDKNKNFISSLVTSRVFTTPSNCEFIRVRTFDSDSTNISLDCVLQIEQGSATPYESYKSNILTVNEDVTLRSNGDICDELNLLTGQLTQRIGEDGVVLSQEVVKTVDLSIQDQDGNTLRKIKPIEGTMHIHSDGTPLKPTITMEIPVEATTQNLASFTKEE